MYHYLQLKRTTNTVLAYSLMKGLHEDFVSQATPRATQINLSVVMTTLYTNLCAGA